MIRLSSKKELILFRIVQEAINNIIKHSHATIVNITLEFSDQDLQIEIKDNGKGFDVSLGNHEGSGLRNMRSRAELIGGTFQMRSSNSGTIVSITTPAHEI